MAHFEKEDKDFVVTEKIGDVSKKIVILETNYTNAIKFIVLSLIKHCLIKPQDKIDLAGIRVIALEEYFLENRLIDKGYLRLAHQTLGKVPLHLGLAPAWLPLRMVRVLIIQWVLHPLRI